MNGQRVFILGPARSGTSILFLALHEVFHLPGEGESHVMPGFQRAIHSFALYCEGLRAADPILAHRLRSQDFRQHVIDYIRNFYAAVFPDGSFVDKTPGAEAIAGAPLIRQVFPDAHIILTRRNGTEAVQSHIHKFHNEFEEACQGWTVCMQAIEQVRPVVPDLLEIDHRDLATQPEQIAMRLASRIQQPERASALAAYFREHWTEADRTSSVTLDNAEWSESQKQTFRRICGPAMQRFGYPL